MPFHIRPFLTLPLAFWFLITLLVLLGSGPAYAEWVSLGDSDSGMTVYVDPDTIRRKGDLVKVWELYDFKTIQTTADISYLSKRVQVEYDCAEERRRAVAVTAFSGNTETGNIVFRTSGEGKWVPVAPRSVNQALWKVACGKP